MLLSELKPNENTKLLLVGPSGSGKTCFAMEFPKPIYVFDTDNKISSAAAHHAGAPWLKDVEYDSYAKQGESDFPIERMNKKLGEMRKDIDAGTFKYKTVIIDSLTTYTEQAFPYLMKMNPGIKRQAINKACVPALQDYGIFKIFTRDLITQTLSFPCSVVMTAHIDLKRDEHTGRLIHRPLMAGALQNSLDVYFENVFYTSVDEGKYWAQTQSDKTYSCRCQIKGLPAKVEMKYDNLIKGDK